MNREIEFVVYGEIRGKGRPRFSKVGKFVKAYTDKDTELYENKIMLSFREEFDKRYPNMGEILFPVGTFVKIEIDCYFQLNKKDYGKKGLNKSGRTKLARIYYDKKPDIDNIMKSVLDGLNKVAYNDDNQVVDISCSKCYTEYSPRLEIRMKEIGILREN